MNEPLPCPWCGHAGSSLYISGIAKFGYAVKCAICGMRGPSGSDTLNFTEAEAVAAWNKVAARVAAALRSAFARGREQAGNEQVDEFNSGYDAAKRGDPIDSEPHSPHDQWIIGYKVADYDRLRSGADAEPVAWALIDNQGKVWDVGIDDPREYCPMNRKAIPLYAHPIAAAAPGVRVWTLWTAKDTLIDAFEDKHDAEASRAWHTAHESGAGPYRVIECGPLPADGPPVTGGPK